MKTINLDTREYQDLVRVAYAPHTPFPQPVPKVMKLPEQYSFDLDRVLFEARRIISDHGLKPFLKDAEGKKKSRSYRGICFTAPEQSEDPLYEGLKFTNRSGTIDNSFIFGKLGEREHLFPPVDETTFRCPTSILTSVFQEVFQKFKSPITKARLVELKSGGVILPHVDYPYYDQIKVHAALETNAQSIWIVEGEKFHIPADGNFYWIDSGRLHAAENRGATDRLHLNINLRVYFNYSGEVLHPGGVPLEYLIDHALV